MKKILLFIALICIVGTNLLTAQSGKPQYLIETKRADTTFGSITIELFPLVAPLHSAYFDSLVNFRFYDSTAFHRVVPDFVIQGGDPNSRNGDRSTWGEGDSSQKNIPAEFSKIPQVRGTIGAARDEDINSANSQFYINLVDNSFLTPNYTCYGQVIEGMEVADSIVMVPRDENDNPLEKIEMFVTAIGINSNVPAVPVLSGPEDGTSAVLNNLKLEWEEVDDAILYDVEVAEDSEFGNIFNFDSTSTAYINLSGLEPGLKTYYWRIRANNGGNKSEYSESQTFITSISPPELEYPPNSSDSVSSVVEFVWHPVEGAATYAFQVATRPTFSSSSRVYDVDGLTDTMSTATGLEEGVKYYWRVRGDTDEYEGPKSNVWNFTTLQTTGVAGSEELPEEFSLKQNYPNPFNPTTTIEYQIPAPFLPFSGGAGGDFIAPTGRGDFAKVRLVIYDILGHEVATLINMHQAPGKYKVEFDASELSSGVFFYKINYGNKSITKKMLLMK